jgi:hypothetical protein
MKVTLEFNLEDHEQRKEHMRAIKSINVYCALSDFAEQLRKIRKYGENSEDVQMMIEELERTFYDILNDRNIDLEGEL